jgi:hypothetical protein
MGVGHQLIKFFKQLAAAAWWDTQKSDEPGRAVNLPMPTIYHQHVDNIPDRRELGKSVRIRPVARNQRWHEAALSLWEVALIVAGAADL